MIFFCDLYFVQGHLHKVVTVHEAVFVFADVSRNHLRCVFFIVFLSTALLIFSVNFLFNEAVLARNLNHGL
jgi:hypothetical protein